MPRILYALTHAASQRLYRWLPGPEPELEASDLDASLEDLARPDAVGEILARERRRAPPRLAWLEPYLSRYDVSGARLIQDTWALVRGCATYGARWLCPLDDDYPPLLRMLADPPPGLFVTGDVDLLKRPTVAVIGSRQATAQAVQACFDVGRSLAARGVTVVSGGAFGCDIAAHHGVLAARREVAPACGVFASGLDALFPVANRGVFRQLKARGAVMLSERPWGAPCEKHTFHARNRLISGLSGTTLVMQAAARSGALMTARLAMDQGRDLAVMRHPEDDVRCLGGQALIAEGALAFETVDDLLARLRLEVGP